MKFRGSMRLQRLLYLPSWHTSSRFPVGQSLLSQAPLMSGRPYLRIHILRTAFLSPFLVPFYLVPL